MFLTVVFEIPDGQVDAYADAAARMVQRHAFSEEQGIKHWSFDQEMRPVSAVMTDTAPDLTVLPTAGS